MVISKTMAGKEPVRSVPFKLATKQFKHFRITLTKGVKDLYHKKLQDAMGRTRRHTKNGKTSMVFI